MRRMMHAALSSLLLGISLGVLAIGSSIGPAAANHSHFRYGHYFWSPAGGTTIDFTLQNAFRRGSYACLNPTTPTTLEQVSCTGPDGRAGIGDVIEESIGGSVFATGDGTIIRGPTGGPLLYRVTSIDPPADSLFGLALDPKSLPVLDTTISHTYPAPGDYLAFTDACCRFTHVNNSNGPYRVETLVNVGTGNSSPRSALPPVVQCPINGLCTFTVPAADPDGDRVRFRLSTSQEAGDPFIQPGPPHAPNPATVDPTTGEYRWDTTGAQVASGGPTLYSTQVTIEDLDPGGARKSKVAVDFLIQLIDVVGAEPTFVHPPTPECGTTRTVQVGSTLAFTVEATDPDPGQTVTLNVAGLPAGAVMTPELPATGNPARSSFAWTPAAAEAGTQVVTFTATDSTGRQALCSVTLSVESDLVVEPGEGGEGTWIPLEAKVSNPNGAPLDASWSAVPRAGVDPGATCTFSDSPSGLPALLTSSIGGALATLGLQGFSDAVAAALGGALGPPPRPQPGDPNAARIFMMCTDDGVFDVTATVSSGSSPPVTATQPVTVFNVLPTVLIEAPETGTRIPLGQAVDVSVAFFDPGTNDTHTCRIEWGDGTTSVGEIIEASGSGICKASHTYAALGEYIITAHLTDDDTPSGMPPAALAMSVAPPGTPPTPAANVPGFEVPSLFLSGAGGTTLGDLQLLLSALHDRIPSASDRVSHLEALRGRASGTSRSEP